MKLNTQEKNKRAYSITFKSLYSAYVAKVERKGRTKTEVDEVISWMTGYNNKRLEKLGNSEIDLKTFFKQAPKMNPARKLITGTICGVRIEEIKAPLMREIRYMDKLIDELAKGRPMEKILRKN